MDNTDCILSTLNRHRVDYLVIGGFNFLLRHSPVLTGRRIAEGQR